MVTPLNATQSDAVHGGPSFSLRNRLFRALWALVWFTLAAWTPAPFHAWRRFLLKSFGAKIGKSVRVYGSAKIWFPPNLTMGDFSVMGGDVYCYCQDKITVGAFATVSQKASLVTGSHRINDPSFQLVTKPIAIGQRAWIAAESFVGPGVTVGEGAVLGARGVSFKDLEPWTVYTGNPAQPLRKRTPF